MDDKIDKSEVFASIIVLLPVWLSAIAIVAVLAVAWAPVVFAFVTYSLASKLNLNNIISWACAIIVLVISSVLINRFFN